MATQATTPSSSVPSVAEFRPPTAAPTNAWAQFLLLLLVFVLINFILTRHSLSPVHQDDYRALGYGFEDMRLLMSRPVSTNFIYLMGALGPAVAFPLLALMTLAVPFLVLRFLQDFFNVRFGWASVVVFGAVSFSHMSALEHVKFLGLFTNLTSHLFGLLALLLVNIAWRNRDLAKGVLAVACFALSAFAKEDFLLPPLILVTFLAYEEIRATRAARPGFGLSRWSAVLGAAIVVTAFAAVAFNFFLSNNPFVSGVTVASAATDPYAVQMGPVAVLQGFAKLTFGFVPLPTALFLASLCVAWWALPAGRLRLVTLAALVVALILPYTLIPNNMPDFRAFSWLSWFGGTIALAILWAAGRSAGAPSKVRGAAMVVIPLALAAGVFLQAYPQRAGVANWYQAQQDANNLMVASLRSHRQLIAREDVVGIVGLDAPSPWSHTDAEFLHRKLFFDNKWIIFVEKDSMFFKIDPVVDGKVTSALGKQFVTIQHVDRLCATPTLLVMVFDATGKGTPVRAADWCGSRRPVAPASEG